MASNIDQKLRKFLVDKSDLIIRYESMDSMMPVEYFITDIVDAYNKYTKINKNADFNTTIENAFKLAIRLNTNIIDAFVELSVSETAQKSGYDITHQYFKEIRGIYNKHNNDFNIEYCEENRDKLIEMNLKTVISIAKKYTGLGLSLNELISAGNLGLVIAYDKFDPSRSKLKDDIIQSISSMPDTFKCDEFEKNIQQFLTYGDVKKKFDERFKTKNELLTKEYVSKWINENVYNAKFNSIATMWIRAYILIAIDNESRIVKKPKSEIYADKEKSGSYKKEVTID
ncbi:MAG: hypothetical protein IKU29_05360, partial [Parabacteroides sp.]|nr:hypothetical protein [Parabacteroides sp.]